VGLLREASSKLGREWSRVNQCHIDDARGNYPSWDLNALSGEDHGADLITTVVVVTRLRLFQELLAALVGSQLEFAVLGVAASEVEAARLIVSQRPEIILLDAALPGVWRVAQTADEEGVRVVVFGLDDTEPDDPALKSRCRAALVAGASSREVVGALNRVRLVELDPPVSPLLPSAEGQYLTPRELDVLALVARGLSNKAIAQELTVSLATVKTHVHNVLQKLGASRRGEIGLMARQQGSSMIASTRDRFPAPAAGSSLGGKPAPANLRSLV
jgi:DNA-binding NarL/FixJ family response regulator